MSNAASPLENVTHPLPFDRYRAEDVEPVTDALLADAQAKKSALAATTELSWATTLGALEAMTERLDDALGIVSHLESVATTDALRKAYNEIQPRISAFYSSIALDPGLYRVLRAYAATDEAKALDPLRKRLLDKTLADFRRAGAELDEAGKERLAAIDVELAEITLKYSQNVLDATNAFELVVEDEARVAGLPPSAKQAARESAERAGKPGFRFTLQAPSYVPAISHLDDRALREQLYRGFITRATVAPWDNRPIVRRVLALRREKARLLGFANFADLVLEDRMAKRGADARAFIQRLHARTTAAFAAENAALAEFAGQEQLAPWDVPYWAEKQRKALYDLDDEALKPYFPLEAALGGAFTIAERLYGVRIEAAPDLPTWNKAVRPYRLTEGGRELAAFYVDAFPREDKRGGAWMHGLLTAHARRPHAVEALVLNATPPTADAPALLDHREVETLFHELGHLLHHALSEVPLRSLAGTSVAWDFVELPSQIMENWCWEPEALALFARHHATNDPLPASLLDRMRRARNFRSANFMMRQLGFAEVDLALHIDYDPASDVDPFAFARPIQEAHSPVPLLPEHGLLASFDHLFGGAVGYAAGYYSYKWAEALDADAFGRFKDEGILSAKTGAAFRKEILARGDAADPAELFRNFRGRDLDPEALLVRSGLA
ncbi:MAG: M3 family metallopeptidase [Myxococcales bacterium]|nr:M3 family metallopeptidase [Myxococcales bacterium]